MKFIILFKIEVLAIEIANECIVFDGGLEQILKIRIIGLTEYILKREIKGPVQTVDISQDAQLFREMVNTLLIMFGS